MSGIYVLLGIPGVMAACSLAYLIWRFFNRRANRRGADVEEHPAGSFYHLGSQPQDLNHNLEHQLLPGSEINDPSLQAQSHRLRPQPLSVRPPLPKPQLLSGPENNEQLAKPPPCQKPIQFIPPSLRMTQLPFGSENDSSLQAQPHLQPVSEHLSHPKSRRTPFMNYGLVIPRSLILKLEGIGRRFPLRVVGEMAEIHASPQSESEVLLLGGIIHHKMTAKEDLLAWKGFPMHEVASENPEELWKEIKEGVRKELKKIFPRVA
ncbi:uncharacterized protein FFE2_04888 [Fusarium fujikuroi]|nr:uncharacterized protein FFE2_04888 [Fusarium fujikuroi]SCV35371.1 uncharacterized protein FFFS_04704 [Fusarium fujikuroi]